MSAPADPVQTRAALIRAAQTARLLREREQNPDPRRQPRPITPDSRLPAAGTLSGA